MASRRSFTDERDISIELRELEALVGLAAVKAEIRRLALRLTTERRYRAQGASILPTRRHMVFSGPAGVGKSLVARAFGQICARLGTLEKGHVVSLDRCDLTATVDENVELMQAKCDAALDGILFVKNEAFLPAGILRSTGDLRLGPVDTMIKFMLRHRGRIIVILDARPKQLDYISFHSGLARRFNETIHFAPYDAFELIQILAAKANSLGLELPDGVECDLLPWIVAQAHRSDWRNAREIEELLAKVLSVRARRYANQRNAVLGGIERSEFRAAIAAMQTTTLMNAMQEIDIHPRTQRLPLL